MLKTLLLGFLFVSVKPPIQTPQAIQYQQEKNSQIMDQKQQNEEEQIQRVMNEKAINQNNTNSQSVNCPQPQEKQDQQEKDYEDISFIKCLFILIPCIIIVYLACIFFNININIKTLILISLVYRNKEANIVDISLFLYYCYYYL